MSNKKKESTSFADLIATIRGLSLQGEATTTQDAPGEKENVPIAKRTVEKGIRQAIQNRNSKMICHMILTEKHAIQILDNFCQMNNDNHIAYCEFLAHCNDFPQSIQRVIVSRKKCVETVTSLSRIVANVLFYSRDSVGKTSMKKEFVPEAIAVTMDVHKDNPKVLKAACNALTNLMDITSAEDAYRWIELKIHTRALLTVERFADEAGGKALALLQTILSSARGNSGTTNGESHDKKKKCSKPMEDIGKAMRDARGISIIETALFQNQMEEKARDRGNKILTMLQQR